MRYVNLKLNDEVIFDFRRLLQTPDLYSLWNQWKIYILNRKLLYSWDNIIFKHCYVLYTYFEGIDDYSRNMQKIKSNTLKMYGTKIELNRVVDCNICEHWLDISTSGCPWESWQIKKAKLNVKYKLSFWQADICRRILLLSFWHLSIARYVICWNANVSLVLGERCKLSPVPGECDL